MCVHFFGDRGNFLGVMTPCHFLEPCVCTCVRLSSLCVCSPKQSQVIPNWRNPPTHLRTYGTCVREGERDLHNEFFVPPNNKNKTAKERPTKTKDSLGVVGRKKKCVHTNRRALISFIKGFMHAWFMLSFFITWLHMIGRRRRKEGRAKGGRGRGGEMEWRVRRTESTHSLRFTD